jgi:hypothetical protein
MTSATPSPSPGRRPRSPETTTSETPRDVTHSIGPQRTIGEASWVAVSTIWSKIDYLHASHAESPTEPRPAAPRLAKPSLAVSGLGLDLKSPKAGPPIPDGDLSPYPLDNIPNLACMQEVRAILQFKLTRPLRKAGTCAHHSISLHAYPHGQAKGRVLPECLKVCRSFIDQGVIRATHDPGLGLQAPLRPFRPLGERRFQHLPW